MSFQHNIYVNQFRIFKDMISDTLIYCSEDIELNKLVLEQQNVN